MAQREVALIVSLDFDVPTKLLQGDASYNELVLREGSKVAENVSEEYHRGHLEATQAQQSTIDKLKEENHRMKQSNMEKTYGLSQNSWFSIFFWDTVPAVKFSYSALTQHKTR